MSTESIDQMFGRAPRTGDGALRRRILAVLETMSYRERWTIKLLYGLEDGYAYTHDEVGRIFKVTRERVRQIEAKAIRKLQQPSRLPLPHVEDVW